MPHMGRILDTMTEWFAEDGWHARGLADNAVLTAGFSGENANWQCFAQAREEQEQFIFYAVAPMKAPADKRAAMAEYLTRANYGLVLGNFELDLDDGEIRYKTSVDLEGTFESRPLIRQCVYACVLTADRYFPGITAILYGNASPKGAVSLVETGGEPVV